MSAKIEPQTLYSTALPTSTQAAVKPSKTTALNAEQRQTLELQLDTQLKAIGMQSTRNAAASITSQIPANEPLHDLPIDAVPSLLAQLPSAISVANATSVASTNADSFSAACMEALRVSQQSGGTDALAKYTQSFKNSDLAAGVNNFVSANKAAA